MMRRATVVALALCLSPTVAKAQSGTFTVTAESADVHKTPSMGGLVIGQISRGKEVEVTRELGSWIKIAWSPAPDGVGYIHMTMGSMRRGAAADQGRTVATAAPLATAPTITPRPPATETAAPILAAGRADRTGFDGPSSQTPPSRTAPRTTYVRPPAHIVGLGGLIGGSPIGFGATARAWSRARLGVQLDASHYQLTALDASGRVTSFDLSPSLLYSLKDHVTDFVWIRPYLGGGAGLHRQTFSALPGATVSVSDNSFGVHAFGGGELTFPNVPQFALSADVGYRWMPTPFTGFDLGGLGIALSARWYIK